MVDARGERVPRMRRVVGRLLEGRPHQAIDAPHGSEAALLLDCPLFDAAYYCERVEITATRQDAVRHYLTTPVPERVSPHRLFDPEHFALEFGRDLGRRDPFLVFLRRRAFTTSTHPLFDLRSYRRRNPESREHPWGPLGHYDEVGERRGEPVNAWLADPDGGPAHSVYDWIDERREEWAERQHLISRIGPRGVRGARLEARYADVPVPRPEGRPLVTVVLTTGNHGEHLSLTLASLADQTLTSWRALVVDTGYVEDLEERLEAALPLGSWDVVASSGTVAADLDAAIAGTTGDYVAFLAGGDVWRPGRLALLVRASIAEDRVAVCDVMRRVKRDKTSVQVGSGLPRGQVWDRSTVDLARLVVRRSELLEVGGIDQTLPGGWDFDLVARIAAVHGVHPVPSLGVTRDQGRFLECRHQPAGDRPRLDHSVIRSWMDVVLNRTLVDWERLGELRQQQGLVSVIIPTYADWIMTVAAVESVVAAGAGPDHELEVVVLDNGCDESASVILDSLPERFDTVRVVHSPTNHGFALGNNIALPHVRGETVVFLNNDTTVTQGWLEPLVTALEDPDVLGSQALLVYPTGVVQSAGVAFPSIGGVPHAFLQGFPVEDADGVDDLAFHALTGAALVMRYADVVAMRGFDPVFRNGMEDIDLCLRLGEARPGGRFVVRAGSVVTHHESQTPGRYDSYDTNRELYLERWQRRAPRDDVALWETRGFTVHGHALAYRNRRQRRLGIPEPVLVPDRSPVRDPEVRPVVSEAPPRLRWAIKNPAPYGPDGERWGDTHFARSMAAALRRLGQHVVIDHREEHERYTGRLDDVALVLRGLAPYTPTPENVTIGWVISHPEMLPTAEALSYDRLVAASVTWAERKSADWGIHVEPLLQATDHLLFHPDLAVPDTGHPVLFVGGSRLEYRPIVKAAVEAGLPISIYGSQWKRYVPNRLVKDAYLPNAELGAAYRSAGVVLNDHWEDMRLDGFLSNRLFDAVASGARVISDEVEGMSAIFGDSVQVFGSPADLVRMSAAVDLDEIFGDDEQRRAVAARIHREHSFEARAQRLLRIALDARRERGFDLA